LLQARASPAGLITHAGSWPKTGADRPRQPAQGNRAGFSCPRCPAAAGARWHGQA